MEKYNEIMEMTTELTPQESEFRETHQTIINAGNLAADCVATFAKNLKHMHDSELYTAAGFGSFEDYTERTMNIKKSQAYKYLSLADNEQLFHSSGKIGITKLSLIAGAPEEHQATLLESAKDNKTVKELKAKLAELQQDNTKKDEALQELQDLKNQMADYADENREAANEKEKEIMRLEQEIKKLKEHLQAQPAPQFKTETKTVEVESKESKEKLHKAQQDLKQKEELLKQNAAEYEKLKKQLSAAGDAEYIKFKLRFEEFQARGDELYDILSGINSEIQPKCRQALTALITRWKNA